MKFKLTTLRGARVAFAGAAVDGLGARVAALTGTRGGAGVRAGSAGGAGVIRAAGGTYGRAVVGQNGNQKKNGFCVGTVGGGGAGARVVRRLGLGVVVGAGVSVSGTEGGSVFGPPKSTSTHSPPSRSQFVITSE